MRAGVDADCRGAGSACIRRTPESGRVIGGRASEATEGRRFVPAGSGPVTNCGRGIGGCPSTVANRSRAFVRRLRSSADSRRCNSRRLALLPESRAVSSAATLLDPTAVLRSAVALLSWPIDVVDDPVALAVAPIATLDVPIALAP